MRRLTKQQFVDRTLVRWKAKFPEARRVAARDSELIGFVYEELRTENYANNFPDAQDAGPNPNILPTPDIPGDPDADL